MSTVNKHRKSSLHIAEISKECVACGSCIPICPFNALVVHNGTIATVDENKCIGCGKCAKTCPASVISIVSKESSTQSHTNKHPKVKKEKHWYHSLWIWTSIYFALGFFNILFAWLGMICFITPLLISIIGGKKSYCHNYCGRGQLFTLLGENLGLSRKKQPPKFLRSAWFRYGFLTFFMTMFFLMIYSTYLVFSGTSLQQAVTLLWVFKLPWEWVNTSLVTPWVAQFAFGFYGVMLTSTVLGLITMILFKPRSWCVYCPMGTMTQGICKLKHKNSAPKIHSGG